MARLLQYLANNRAEGSLAVKLRRQRFAFFRSLLESVPRPFRILDVGGTEQYWGQMGFADEAGVEVVILNIDPVELTQKSGETGRTRFSYQQGDGRAMPQFSNGEFEVVFSNSVIEHVGTRDDRTRFMNEVARVGVRFFVQTPNFYFPIEPHFHVVGFQFMPVALRRWLLQHFDLGWTPRTKDAQAAEDIVRGVELLSAQELLDLCPSETRLYRERFFGLTKSITAHYGFGSAPIGK